MARSLVSKGADFVAAMVFMFASTNLVIELGIVLVVLMGWQFAVSEFVGGIIMIVLLVTAGALWLRGRAVTGARDRAVAAGDQRRRTTRAGPRGPDHSEPRPRRPRRRARGQGPAAPAASVQGRLVGRGQLHHARPDHAAPGTAHRLPRRRPARGAGAGVRLARPVPDRARLVDQRRERDRRAVRGDDQLRLLDRQRPAGGGAVAGRDLVRRRDRVPVRRPDRLPAAADLPRATTAPG